MWMYVMWSVFQGWWTDAQADHDTPGSPGLLGEDDRHPGRKLWREMVCVDACVWVQWCLELVKFSFFFLSQAFLAVSSTGDGCASRRRQWRIWARGQKKQLSGKTSFTYEHCMDSSGCLMHCALGLRWSADWGKLGSWLILMMIVATP